MSRSQCPGSCQEIYPFLSTPLQLWSRLLPHPSLDFLHQYPFPPWYLTKTVHGKHSHLLPAPCAVLWLPHGSSGEETKPAEAAADVPKAAQSQHKCSPTSLQISALYILIEAPGTTREAASCSSFLVSAESGKGWVCRKILQFLNRDSGAKIQLIFGLYNKLCCLFAFLLLFYCF